MALKVVQFFSGIESSKSIVEFTKELNKYVDIIIGLINEKEPKIKKDLEAEGISSHFFPFSGKKSIPGTFAAVFKYLRKVKPAIVHTNLQYGDLIGLPAAKLAGVKSRIFTRHHTLYHKIYHPRYFYVDKYFINPLSTRIVAPSGIVKKVLIEYENVPENKIEVIPHPYLLPSPESISQEQVAEMKRKYDIYGNSPVIGVISRFVHWKGIQYVIPAFKRFLGKYPNAVLVLTNAVGDYYGEIVKLLESVPKRNYRLIRFEEDIAMLYKTFDIFVHVPIDSYMEAFGNIYVESMVLGVPMICTISGVANDIVKHRENAYVVPHKDAESIYQALVELWENPKLRKQISAEARKIAPDFQLQNIIKQYAELYQNEVGK